MLELAHNVSNTVGTTDIFTLSDDNIMDLVNATHVHKLDDEFDEDSMFVVVESIIKRSHHIVSNVLQGTNAHLEIVLEDKRPKVGFMSPMCTLKSICSEFSCKPAGDEYVHSSTMEILMKLSEFSWDSKAVLALAAFCLDYGDFWLLAQTLKQSDQFIKSLANLRRVTVLLNPGDSQKRKRAMLELNALVMATFEAVEVIFELNSLSDFDPKDVPALSEVFQHIPVDVYWIISSVVACSVKINILSSEVDKPFHLAPYAQKVHYIINMLNRQLILCKQQVVSISQRTQNDISLPSFWRPTVTRRSLSYPLGTAGYPLHLVSNFSRHSPTSIEKQERPPRAASPSEDATPQIQRQVEERSKEAAVSRHDVVLNKNAKKANRHRHCAIS